MKRSEVRRNLVPHGSIDYGGALISKAFADQMVAVRRSVNANRLNPAKAKIKSSAHTKLKKAIAKEQKVGYGSIRGGSTTKKGELYLHKDFEYKPPEPTTVDDVTNEIQKMTIVDRPRGDARVVPTAPHALPLAHINPKKTRSVFPAPTPSMGVRPMGIEPYLTKPLEPPREDVVMHQASSDVIMRDAAYNVPMTPLERKRILDDSRRSAADTMTVVDRIPDIGLRPVRRSKKTVLDMLGGRFV